jgi:HEAT repeat protein
MDVYLFEPSVKEICTLIEGLLDPDPNERNDARISLIAMGRPAVPELIKALKSQFADQRLAAAEILGEIRDGDSAPVLVRALLDHEESVRQAAANSLVSLHKDAFDPLMHGLVEFPESEWMREGALSVLNGLYALGLINKSDEKILDVLQGKMPVEFVRSTASDLISKLERE